MLGRTDSRRRLLVVLVVFLVIGASLGAGSSGGRSSSTTCSPAKAARQTTVRVEQPVRRGTIYDRTGTVVLATTVERYLVAASPDQLTRVPAAATSATELVTILGLDGDAATALTDKVASARPYVVLAHGIEDGDRRTDPRADRRRDAPGGLARARAGAGLPAGRRRRRDDPRGAPARVRQPRRGGPVRRRGALPDRARGHAPDPPRRSRRRRPAGHGRRRGRQPGRARVGPPADDRHRPPARRRAGGPRRATPPTRPSRSRPS